MDLLRNLHRAGATICMVTHDPRFRAVRGSNHPSLRWPHRGRKRARSEEVAMETIWQDLRYGFRMLAGGRLFAVLAS